MCNHCDQKSFEIDGCFSVIVRLLRFLARGCTRAQKTNGYARKCHDRGYELSLRANHAMARDGCCDDVIAGTKQFTLLLYLC